MEHAHSQKLSVAPMMDWTDRHCRFFHRLMSRQTLLYTEMVTAPALVRGNAVHLLEFDPAEQPVALQLGGSDPSELAKAARLGDGRGYDEINLNVGCPSDRVQSGTFGAVLMLKPDLVGDCVRAMADAIGKPVTVKCRLGVDEQKVEETLPRFLETMIGAGVGHVAIHARKAWLQGLSPKENRDVPPLDYDLVRAMKARFPDLEIAVNGGIASLDEAEGFLADGLDGAMIGRTAYQTPAAILLDADQRIFGGGPGPTRLEVVDRMVPYIEAHVAEGGRAHSVTRHMLGLFSGLPGARAWRRSLSEAAARPGAGPEVLIDAVRAMEAAGASA